MDCFVVTIDGPAASGKSTVARLLAEKLDAVFLDTGAMYRAVTLAAMQAGVDLADEKQLLEVLSDINLSFTPRPGGMTAVINDVDVTTTIRQPQVTANSRYIAAAPAVRDELVKMQRDFANKHKKIVTEGRDQGTVAFPDAEVKFFLTADIETRAKRRLGELNDEGGIAFNELVKAIAERDQEDRQRNAGPLKPAADAIDVDTSDLTIEQVVENLLEHVREKC